MSSLRSRSGGTVIGNTDSRKYRSSRNCRAATACLRCRLVAATTRTSILDLDVAAEPIERARFERAQDLALQRQRQLADFVEKQRAAVGELELAELALGCAGERATFVAKQLGFEQRLRESRRS